jgi:hypothetical protein
MEPLHAISLTFFALQVIIALIGLFCLVRRRGTCVVVSMVFLILAFAAYMASTWNHHPPPYFSSF